MTKTPFLWLLLALPLTASAADAGKDKDAQQRRILNEGYSILYRDARTLSAVKYLLWIKLESDDFDAVVTEVSEFGTRLHSDLADLPSRYPAVKVDLDPLPEMEKRKRIATGWDKFKSVAPLTGADGRKWERIVLNSMTNGINQERHLAAEIAKDETDPGLKQFALKTQAEMDRLYEKCEALMERDYFK